MSIGSRFSDYFQQIYIINLPERKDRRDEMEEQLALIGLSLNHPKVQLFAATRPTNAGEFESIGARGCFMSHLEVLRDARSKKLDRLLILEDDLNFSNDFLQRINDVLNQLEQSNWGIFYGGYDIQFTPEDKSKASDIALHDTNGVIEIPASTGVVLAHFVAFQSKAIGEMVSYLELLLSRKGGDPRGGPMHVDGAYSWFRNLNPTYKTVISIPELGYQRSSRTDIHKLRWYDRMPLIRSCTAYLRKLKNQSRY